MKGFAVLAVAALSVLAVGATGVAAAADDYGVRNTCPA
jgi:hypothetical protein